MKKKYWIIGAIVAVIAVLGIVFTVQANNNAKKNEQQNQYNIAMSAGKDAVDAKNYKKAEKYFERAENYKENDLKAESYGNQAENFADAMDEIDEFEFDEVLNKLKEVQSEPDGYSVMNTQAKKLAAKISKVQDNIENEIKPLQDQAEAQEDSNNFSGAVETYDQILALDYIDGKYYTKVYQEVKADRTEADNKASQSQSSSSSDADDDDEDDNKGTPSEGATSSDKEIDGQPITDQMIADAKKQLSALGENPVYWSPLDIMKIIKYSRENGHSQITKEDLQNYLSVD